MKTLRLILLFITLNVIMASCEKEDFRNGIHPQAGSFPSKIFSVRLTDAPGVFGAMYIDLQGVEVTCSNGKTVQLRTSVGRYNLRTLTNGKDTLIATGTVPGNVSKVRLILGDANTVVSSTMTYALNLSEEDLDGLSIPVNPKTSYKNESSVLLDFDANQSVIDMGNNEFKLKPVVRNVDLVINGCIKGKVTPYGLYCAITATSAYGSFSTFVDDPNEFKLMGIPAGKYTLHIVPNIPLLPTDIENVVVNSGAMTDMGTLKF